ncbi:MAG: phospholipid carrier-dependent glycosyltransferase, partial [Acidobacteria bacterium]|nr:phospholipid carrier-dependent glycosyltransferase [Acidobacteriota bacterium]
KPLGYFASSALSMRLLGVNELAARLPAFLSALLLVAVTAAFARHLFGRRAAWIAGIAAAASPLLIAFSRIAIFDSMLSLFVVLALVAFYRAVETFHGPPEQPSGGRGLGPGSWSSRTWAVVAWLAMVAGVMTKGPVALALPLLVAAPFAAWRKAAKAVWRPAGIFAFLGLIVPWITAMEMRVPGFLHYSLMVETFRRVTTDEMQRTGPLWYFLPYLIGGAFPWSLVAAAGWIERRRETRSRGEAEDPAARIPWVFLALWLALPLILFSLSQSKRPQYILPLIPCLAILAGASWDRALLPARTRPLPGQRAAAVIFLLLGAVFLATAFVPEPWFPRVKAVEGDLVRGTLIGLAVAGLLGGILSWRARGWATALVALALPTVAFPLVTGPLFGEIAESRSTRQLAALIERQASQGRARVAVLDEFPHSLLFYLEQTVDFATRDGAALRNGFVERDFERHLSRPETRLHSRSWWKEAVAGCSPKPLFVAPEKYPDVMAEMEASPHRRLGSAGAYAVFGPCESGNGDHVAAKEGGSRLTEPRDGGPPS